VDKVLIKPPRPPIEKILLALIFLFVFVKTAGAERRVIEAYARYVIDGDTIVIDGGDKVRYIGIDTPEMGESFAEAARERNISLVNGKRLRLVICPEEPRDKYGRLLAFVYSDGVFVNRLLVSEGLARKLMIPPCGLPVAQEFMALEREAKEKGLGLWGHGTAPGAGDR
jgi:micrococcal nuclease